jgi:hypothetical protein
MTVDVRRHGFGWGWVILCVALALHILDEATTGFLAVYNPTVLAVRQRWGWFPMPTFEFREWLSGLIVVCLILAALSVFAFSNAKWLRPLAYVFAMVMLLNGIGHTLATVFGQTVASVQFQRPAPGFYSSPLMIGASIYLLRRLRCTRVGAQRVNS